jgi:hypothetical protein
MIKKLKGPLWLQVLIAMALGLTTGLLLAPQGREFFPNMPSDM